MAPVSTACVADGSLAVGATCTEATSTAADQCKDGSFCVPSPTGGGPICQQLCTSDTGCAGDLGMSGICGLVLNGLETQSVGLCFAGRRQPEDDICPQLGASNCRYTLHAGGMFDAQGMCLAGGELELGSPCTRASSATECGASLLCEGGTCQQQCQQETECSSDFPGTICTLISSAMVQMNGDVNGYCGTITDAGVPDLLRPGRERYSARVREHEVAHEAEHLG